MKLSKYQISRIYKKIQISDEKSIILIDVMGDKNIPNESNEVRSNIYCVDSNYNIIWQVSEDEESRFEDGDPFCYLDYEDNEVTADRFSGFEYKIDIETGKVTRTGFHK